MKINQESLILQDVNEKISNLLNYIFDFFSVKKWFARRSKNVIFRAFRYPDFVGTRETILGILNHVMTSFIEFQIGSSDVEVNVEKKKVYWALFPVPQKCTLAISLKPAK